jgi:hypothetical protein
MKARRCSVLTPEALNIICAFMKKNSTESGHYRQIDSLKKYDTIHFFFSSLSDALIKDDGVPLFERPNKDVRNVNISESDADKFSKRENANLPDEFDSFTYGDSLKDWIAVFNLDLFVLFFFIHLGRSETE